MGKNSKTNKRRKKKENYEREGWDPASILKKKTRTGSSSSSTSSDNLSYYSDTSGERQRERQGNSDRANSQSSNITIKRSRSPLKKPDPNSPIIPNQNNPYLNLQIDDDFTFDPNADISLETYHKISDILKTYEKMNPTIPSTLQPPTPKKLTTPQTKLTTTNTQNKQQTPDQTQLLTRKPPPIFITTTETLKIMKIINTTVNNKATYKASNNTLRCYTDNTNDHYKTIQILKSNNIQFFSHNSAENRPTKVVLKSIPKDITIDEIKTELRLNDIEFTDVARLKSHRPTDRINDNTSDITCSVLVTLPKTSTDKIYQLQTLFYLRITIEPYRRNCIPQCHNCQRYGHSSNFCNLSTKCVKCAQNHSTKDCKKTTDTPATCANCNGEHPASYRGCPVHKQIMAHQANQTRHKQQPDQHNKNLPANHKQHDKTTDRQAPTANTPTPMDTDTTSAHKWTEFRSKKTNKPEPQSQTIKPQKQHLETQPTSKQTDNTDADADNPIRELIGMLKQFNIKKMMVTLKKYFEESKKLSDPMDKIFLLIEIAASYFD